MPNVRVYVDDIVWNNEKGDLPTLVRLDFEEGEYRDETVILQRLADKYGAPPTSQIILAAKVEVWEGEKELTQIGVVLEDIGCTATIKNIVYDTIVDGIDMRDTIDPADIPTEMFIDFDATSDDSYSQLVDLAKEEATFDWLIVSADIAVKTHD